MPEEGIRCRTTRQCYRDRLYDVGETVIYTGPKEKRPDYLIPLRNQTEPEQPGDEMLRIATPSQAAALAEVGISTLEEVAAAEPSALMAAHGIGAASADKLVDSAIFEVQRTAGL